MTTEVEAIYWLRRIGEHGLAAARASENTAREHLEDLLEMCDLLITDRTKTIERLRALKAAKRTRSATGVEDTAAESG